MRKHILPRLKALFTAACATLYTRQARPTMPKFSLEPDTRHLPGEDDTWLFEPDAVVEAALKLQSLFETDPTVLETEINPLMVLEKGAVAADALIRKEKT